MLCFISLDSYVLHVLYSNCDIITLLHHGWMSICMVCIHLLDPIAGQYEIIKEVCSTVAASVPCVTYVPFHLNVVLFRCARILLYVKSIAGMCGSTHLIILA